MADIELIQERLISGTGLLRVPAEAENIRYLRLNIDVIREVAQPFNSNKWSPSRSRYCTLVFMRNEYVIQEEAVDYPRRQYEWVSDSPGQALNAVKCAYKGTLQTFVNLGIALNLVPISVTNLIEEYSNLPLLWDEVRVVCEGTTAVQVRLYSLEYDDECLTQNEQELPPPEPPEPPVLPDVPIPDISLPYDDDDITSPAPIDDIPEEPPLEGEECTAYNVLILAGSVSQPDLALSVQVWGEVGAARLAPGTDTVIELFCRDRVSTGACTKELDFYTAFTVGAAVVNGPTVLSITEV